MDKTTAAALVAVLTLLVTGFVILTVRGVATTEYLLFLSGPIVSALVGLVLTKRTDALQKTTDVVAHQTNSLLSTRLDRIDAGQTAAAGDRAVLREMEQRTIHQTPPKL